jgi:hypothetical protein
MEMRRLIPCISTIFLKLAKSFRSLDRLWLGRLCLLRTHVGRIEYDNALKLPVKKGKVIVESPKTQAEISKILEEGELFAKKRLDEHWDQVVALSDRLVEKGHLEKDEIDHVLATHAPAKTCVSLGDLIP